VNKLVAPITGIGKATAIRLNNARLRVYASPAKWSAWPISPTTGYARWLST